MPGARRIPVALALAGSAVGLTFAAISSADYVTHLDRQLHDIHCSYIPGAGVEEAADNACRTAMYSPYSALLRDQIWGGIPIGLFAVGAFSFFVAFSLFLLLADRKASRRSYQFFALAAATPVAASIAMGVISATELGSFCKTCVGIYVASGLLAVGAIVAWWMDRKEQPARSASGGVAPTVVDEGEGEAPAPPRRVGAAWLIPAWFVLLGAFAATPAGVYHQLVPSFEDRIADCGELETLEDPKDALIHITPDGAEQPVVMVVDPLCPTCKAFHQRLVADDIFEQLDTTLVLFPLDGECNWNLDTRFHPGACVVSKAVLCGEDRALDVLEWSYEQQERLVEIAEDEGDEAVVDRIAKRFPDLEDCIGDEETRIRLDAMIRFGVRNELPVSTPQLFVGKTRLCDADSDIGLPYTLTKLAPELASR